MPRPLRDGSLFDPPEPSTVETVEQDIYGGHVETNRHSAGPIALASIRPDPRQPRRLLPGAARLAFDGTSATAAAALEIWAAIAEEEGAARLDKLRAHRAAKGEPLEKPDDLIPVIPIRDYLDLASGYERPAEEPSDDTPARNRLLKLVALAGDIMHIGQIEDATVVRSGGGHIIESGERRWWAHHLLLHYTGDQKFSHMIARVEKKLSIKRQASTNGNRQELNAIGKAREIALLIIDALGEEKFQPFDVMVRPGDIDLAYYAQVADGQRFNLPYGAPAQIADAMGLSTTQVRQYRALLTLSPAQWQHADENDLTEGAIRAMRKKPVTTVTGLQEKTPAVAVKISPQTAERLKELHGVLEVEDDDQAIARLIEVWDAYQNGQLG